MQEDYQNYPFKQQCIVITVNGEIPNVFIEPENTVKNGVSPKSSLSTKTTHSPKALRSTFSGNLSPNSGNSLRRASTSTITTSNTSSTSRIIFNKTAQVADLCKEDLLIIAADYERPNDCLIATLVEPLRSNYQKSAESWSKLCTDLGERFRFQLNSLIQFHQEKVEELRISRDNLKSGLKNLLFIYKQKPMSLSKFVFPGQSISSPSCTFSAFLQW